MPVDENLLEHIGEMDDELLGGDEKARELPRALAGGTNAMRAGVSVPSPSYPGAGEVTVWSGKTTKWLPVEQGETESEYQERVHRSYLYPFYSDAITLNVGRVFAKSPTLDDDADDEIVELAENIDLQGTHWAQFARERFWQAIHDGVCFILVDHPPVDEEKNTAATDAIVRPYWVPIDAGQVLGMDFANVGSQLRLKEFRYKETYSERKGLQTEQLERVRRFVAGNPEAEGEDRYPKLQTYIQDDKEEWKLDSEVPFKRPVVSGESAEIRAIEEAYFIPIVPVYGNRVGPWRGRPYFRDLGSLNLQHFQKKSDVDRILHAGQVPLLFGPGFDGDSTVQMGAYRMVRNTNENSKLMYVEPTGAMVAQAREDLHDLEGRQTIASLEPVTRRASGTETATAKIIDEAKGRSVLAALALGLQDSLENAFLYTANWKGQAEGPKVAVNTDYGVAFRDVAELQLMLNAALAGKLPTEDFLSEMRRRGALPEEYDVEDALEKLEREGPALGEV